MTCFTVLSEHDKFVFGDSIPLWCSLLVLTYNFNKHNTIHDTNVSDHCKPTPILGYIRSDLEEAEQISARLLIMKFRPP